MTVNMGFILWDFFPRRRMLSLCSSSMVGQVQVLHRSYTQIVLTAVAPFSGSFLEFLGVLNALQQKYTPDELPYHVIVPSLPGYAFSEPPPLDRDWKLRDSARLLNKLMLGLGFDGYVVQGGDIGSYTARIIASTYDACKGWCRNLNLLVLR